MARAEGDVEDIYPHTQPADKAGRDLSAQTGTYPLIKTLLNGIRDESTSLSAGRVWCPPCQTRGADAAVLMS